MSVGGGMNNTLVKGSLRGRCNRGAGICDSSTNLFQRLTNAFGGGMGANSSDGTKRRREKWGKIK